MRHITWSELMNGLVDPAMNLAFSVQNNKGVFALLLGSGLSRAAGIPTGWEITLDLVRRVAMAKGVEEQDDWEKWYIEEESKEPNYSEVLERLAATSVERRAILDTFIEPNKEDREKGRKVPTRGHHAIARLVQQGYVRVIVTTNFDRLMENALRKIGVEPTVIISPDSLQGAESLTHSTCYILKLHGDYKDARILNTDDELSAYPDAYNTVLDRIFDEHGLIVCGWSGEWDHALRGAIERAPNRRYPMFWASRGHLKERAAELCSARKGTTVPISDADSFLVNLVEQVETLTQSQKQSPSGVDMLMNRAKRYLSKSEHRIQLADLVSGEVERVISRLDQDDMALDRPTDDEEMLRGISICEGISEGLTKVCGLIGRWGDFSQVNVAVDAVHAILSFADDNSGGNINRIEQRQYPAVLAYHACALGLQYSENWSELHKFMGHEFQEKFGRTARFLDVVGPSSWKGNRKELWQKLPGMDRRHTPLNDHLADNIFINWGTAFLPPRAPLPDMTLLNEALTAIRYLEKMDLEQLQSEMSKIGAPFHPSWIPIGRAGWDRKYREKFFRRLWKQILENNWWTVDLAVVARISFWKL